MGEGRIVAELQGVTKRYGPVTALDCVNLSCEAGRVTALLGPNGAGKTTAVRLLLGLTRPTEGRAQLFGKAPETVGARQHVGVMLQIAKVPETLTVGEHIHLFGSYYPTPLAFADVVRRTGLDGLERRRFGKLSGGQRQRVLFALAICGNPDLLVLDEPTVGLDVEARRSFWRETRRLADAGRSILLTTHYLEEADALADRIVVLRQGRVIVDGTPDDVKTRGAGCCIRCVTTLTESELRAMPGVLSVEQDRGTTVLMVTAAEPVARELLTRDRCLAKLEIERAGLAEAFLALTSESAVPAATFGGIQ